jgi:CRISPR system Cascade subunit CasE
MYFSRIRFTPENHHPGEIAKQLLTSVYHEHKLLWDFFPEDKDADRDFLYRRFDTGRYPQYFVLSERKPEMAKDIWEIESKEFNPVIEGQQRYSFNLRANPIITKKTDDPKSKKRIKNDIYMEAIARNKLLPEKEIKSSNQILTESGTLWLTSRCENYGFFVNENDILVEGYQKLSGMKDRDKHNIQIGAIDYSGILTVTDPEKFRQTLLTGIGKSRAFGCGLLLIRRV